MNINTSFLINFILGVAISLMLIFAKYTFFASPPDPLNSADSQHKQGHVIDTIRDLYSDTSKTDVDSTTSLDDIQIDSSVQE